MDLEPSARYFRRASRLVDGMIIPPTHLELIAVDHCNISCKSCNHASPLVPPWCADPDRAYRDLATMAKYLRPKFLKVIGGEPFLHGHLRELLGAARASGVAGHLTLTTNGTLLDKMDDALWELVDELEISVYPGMKETWRNILKTREKALALGKEVTVYEYPQFRATFCTRGARDPKLPEKIYAACKIANFWGCHAVRDGYFFKCPQSIYVPMLTGTSADADRIAILDTPSFQANLLEFINSPLPLHACNHCVGTVGIQEDVEQQSCDEWRAHIDQSMEDIVDFPWLERSLTFKSKKDDCKQRLFFNLPQALAHNSLFQRLLPSLWAGKSDRFFLRRGKSHRRR